MKRNTNDGNTRLKSIHARVACACFSNQDPSLELMVRGRTKQRIIVCTILYSRGRRRLHVRRDNNDNINDGRGLIHHLDD